MDFFGTKSRAQVQEQAAQIVSLEQELAERNKEVSRLQKIEEFFNSHGGQEVWDLEKQLEKVRADLRESQLEKEMYDKEISRLSTELDPLVEQITVKDLGLDVLENPAKDSVQLQMKIREYDGQIKKAGTEGKAISTRQTFEGVERKAVANSIIRSVKDLAMLAYNSQAQLILSKATPANLETSLTRLLRLAETIEKKGAGCNVKIAKSYQTLWTKQLLASVEHDKAKALAKELEREHKAELREQARVERELEQEKKRLEKEMEHYRNVLHRLGDAAQGEAGDQLREQIAAIEASIADVDYRKANQRAGYVYVISNIGSFGENMVKIGLTRRLNPLDRVQELSDASVPFNFDVHALFFSDDAVKVETELHRHFSDERVNLINKRREFFAVTPAQVKDALEQIAGNLLEFKDEPEAEQFYQTQALRRTSAHE